MISHKNIKSDVCSSEGVKKQHCSETFCECLHLIDVPKNEIVDLVLLTDGNFFR